MMQAYFQFDGVTCALVTDAEFHPEVAETLLRQVSDMAVVTSHNLFVEPADVDARDAEDTKS